jgi:SynChlorMet cassette radical SAM/SPASM protein ScmE
METLLELSARYNGRISAAAGPLAEGKGWLEMEQARKEGREMAGRGFLVGCGGPMNQIAVRADGAITPCAQMPHMVLGRINQDDLREIWRNHPELNRLRERRAIPLSSFEFCSGCEYMTYCTGSCPALAYTITGSAYHPAPDACLRKFLEEGGRLPAATNCACCA